jgi:hypothetical protein
MPREHDAFESLTLLVRSKDWIEYVGILHDHKQYLQSKVNEYVKAQDLFKAYGELCKMNDIDNVLGIVEKSVKEIESKYKKKEA